MHCLAVAGCWRARLLRGGRLSGPGEADEKVYNIIHLIYHAKRYERSSKDYEFSRRTMEEHWKSGYDDAHQTPEHPEVLQRRESLGGVFTFDLFRKRRKCQSTID